MNSFGFETHCPACVQTKGWFARIIAMRNSGVSVKHRQLLFDLKTDSLSRCRSLLLPPRLGLMTSESLICRGILFSSHAPLLPIHTHIELVMDQSRASSRHAQSHPIVQIALIMTGLRRKLNCLTCTSRAHGSHGRDRQLVVTHQTREDWHWSDMRYMLRMWDRHLSHSSLCWPERCCIACLSTSVT